MNTTKKKKKMCKSFAPIKDISDTIEFCEYLEEHSHQFGICPMSIKKLKKTIIRIGKKYSELEKERDALLEIINNDTPESENEDGHKKHKGFYLV